MNYENQESCAVMPVQDHDEAILVKRYPIQKLSDFKGSILEVIREMGIEEFSDDQVRGMYVFGSQAYFSKISALQEDDGEYVPVCYRNDEKKEVIHYLKESDFDIILVVDDYQSKDELLGALASDMQSKWETSITINNCIGEELEFKLDVSVYNTKYFISYMHYHQPVYNQSVTSFAIDQRYVIFEDERMKFFRKNWVIYHMNIPRLIVANSDEIDYCFQKAQRFWELAHSGSHTDEREHYQDVYSGYLSRRPAQALMKTAKKNIVHAKRKLFFSKQMLSQNEIVDYEEMNEFQQEVLSTNLYSWDNYKQTYRPELDQLKAQFTLVCNEVIGFGKKLLERQKNAVTFLNKFCIPMESLSKVKDSLKTETKHLKNNVKTQVQSYATNLFMNGIYVLNHLFGMRVLPFEAYDSSSILDATLFQCSVPPNVNLHPHLMELDGCIIKLDKNYSVVSQTCGKTMDMRDPSIEPRFDDNLRCFKLPYGKRVSLFHYNNEWKVSCPELDYQDWIYSPVQKSNGSTWREDFWRVLAEQNISLDQYNKEASLLLIWNESQITLIGTYGDKQPITKLLGKPNIITEDKEITKYMQDNLSPHTLKQTIIEKSVKLNPKEYSGFLFMKDNGQVVYHLSSPLHYLIPKMTLANKFYSGVDVLNKKVIENTTDSTLLQNTENCNGIISCAALADEYSEQVVEDCFRLLNPVFRSYYLLIRKELLKEENKDNIPLLKEAALTLEYSKEVLDIIEDVFYSAESFNDETMSETE